MTDSPQCDSTRDIALLLHTGLYCSQATSDEVPALNESLIIYVMRVTQNKRYIYGCIAEINICYH